MGKKGKRQPSKIDESIQFRKRSFNRLSRPKRNQLNILVDNLLKLASGVPPKLWDHHVEIQDILKGIIEIEAEITPPNNVDRSSQINSFEKWLSENGAGFEGVKVVEFPGYDLGLKALKPFKEDSLVLTIPRQLMLTDEDAQQSILKELTEKDPLLKHMLNVRLTLYLLTEKVTEDSFWRPYINILPSKYTTVLYFTVQEMEFLKGSPVFERTLFLYQSIARQYAYFYKLLHTSGLEVAKLLRETFTFDQYRWAVSTIMTRQNLVPSTNPELNTLALIPLWDMCNHTDGKITTDYNVDLQRGECYAIKDFSEGDQIFIFYGIRTNSNLFLHNGFVYPDNVHDSLLIPLGISSGDPLKNEKLELIEKLRLPSQFHLDHGSEPVGAFVLAFARVFCMTKDELSAWNSNPDFMNLLLTSSPTESHVNPDLDKRAYSFLNMRFNLILSTYKITPNIIEDIQNDVAKIKITESEDQQNVHRNIVRQLKKSEAVLLNQAINYTKTNMELFAKKLQ